MFNCSCTSFILFVQWNAVPARVMIGTYQISHRFKVVAAHNNTHTRERTQIPPGFVSTRLNVNNNHHEYQQHVNETTLTRLLACIVIAIFPSVFFFLSGFVHIPFTCDMTARFAFSAYNDYMWLSNPYSWIRLRSQIWSYQWKIHSFYFFFCSFNRPKSYVYCLFVVCNWKRCDHYIKYKHKRKQSPLVWIHFNSMLCGHDLMWHRECERWPTNNSNDRQWNVHLQSFQTAHGKSQLNGDDHLYS